MYNNKIIVKRSCIMIMDYNRGDCNKLENQFYLYDRVIHTKTEFGMYFDENNSILYLPKIDVDFVMKCLGSADVYYDNSADEFDYIKGGVNLKYGPRDDDQKEALRFMTGNGEYSKHQKASQLSVCLGTGKGKTYLAIATTSFYEMKSIIITYSVNWLEQWRDRIIEYTDITKDQIKMINSSATITKFINSKKTPKYKIYLVTHSALKSYASTNGWESIGILFRKLKIGVKVIDEAHLNFINISMIDFFTNTLKTYYLTATPARSSEEENAIYANYFRNVPAISLFDEQQDPHTMYIALKFNSRPTIYDLNNCKNMYGLDRNKYIDYLIDRPVYIKLLTIILDLALKNEGKCLIYIGTNKAIMYTYKWIMMNYPELYNNVGIFTTLIDKNVREFEKDKKIILSTTKSAGAAMDIKGLKLTVVLNEPFKSHVLAQQSLGRTRDDNTFYIECVDMGFKQIKKYYYYKHTVFETYALSCSDMPMRDNEIDARYNNILNNRISNTLPPERLIIWNKPKTCNFINWNI